jgi:ferredoxin
MCTDLGVRLVNLKEFGFRKISCQGEIMTSAYISSLVLDSDFVINLPKMKTHSFMAFTGAIKNMYGIIPHGLRCNFHREYDKSELFGQMLVDLFSCAQPQLNIMDAIVAMEGEGPSAGSPRKVGLVLASVDAVALDAVASKIIGLDPMQIRTTDFASQRGLGTADWGKIELLGENILDIEVQDFKQSAIAVGLIRKNIPAFLHGFIQWQLVLVPRVLRKKCTACKECVDICPTGAASLAEGRAIIDKSRCIHCMCCHEVCRFYAIRLGQRPFGKILRAMTTIYKRILSFLS